MNHEGQDVEQNRPRAAMPKTRYNGHIQKWSFAFEGYGAKLRHHYSGKPNGWGSVMVFVAAALLALLVYLLVR